MAEAMLFAQMAVVNSSAMFYASKVMAAKGPPQNFFPRLCRFPRSPFVV